MWKAREKQQTNVNPVQVERIEPPTQIIKTTIQKAEEEPQNLTDKQLYNLAETYHYGRYGKTINLEKAITLYVESAQKTSDFTHKGKCYLALGRLYKDGSSNNVPDGRTAIRYYLKALECGYEDSIIEISKIYMYGLHPNYLPDKLTAGKICNRVSHDQRYSENLKVQCSVYNKELSELNYRDLDSIPQLGQKYIMLPYTIIEDICAAWEICLHSRVPVTTCTTQNMPAITPVRRTTAPQTTYQNSPYINDINIQNTLWNDIAANNHRAGNINILDILPQHNIKSDSQNVHNSSVQSAVKSKLEAIENNQHIDTNFETNKNEFMYAIQSLPDLSVEESGNAMRVLASLTDAVHSRYNKGETDIFNNVWSRINNPVNKDRRRDMILMLAQNMASGVEHDKIVCSTGKVVRIVGSLDGMDAEPLPELKPEWAINEEISQAAAKVRQEILESSTDAEKEAYEALEPSETQQQLAKALSDKMRASLVAKCEKDYVDNKIIDKTIMDIKLRDYLDNF